MEDAHSQVVVAHDYTCRRCNPLSNPCSSNAREYEDDSLCMVGYSEHSVERLPRIAYLHQPIPGRSPSFSPYLQEFLARHDGLRIDSRIAYSFMILSLSLKSSSIFFCISSKRASLEAGFDTGAEAYGSGIFTS